MIRFRVLIPLGDLGISMGVIAPTDKERELGKFLYINVAYHRQRKVARKELPRDMSISEADIFEF
jgi:hypothetical protein